MDVSRQGAPKKLDHLSGMGAENNGVDEVGKPLLHPALLNHILARLHLAEKVLLEGGLVVGARHYRGVLHAIPAAAFVYSLLVVGSRNTLPIKIDAIAQEEG